MSQYIRFVLEREGVPLPSSVVIIPHVEDWANRQIRDEFRALFPHVEINFEDRPITHVGTLLVIPFNKTFALEFHDRKDLLRSLACIPHTWAMLYGLSDRAVTVMVASTVLRYQRRCERVARVMRLVVRFRLQRLLYNAALRWIS
jgi:hypothetical protein